MLQKKSVKLSKNSNVAEIHNKKNYARNSKVTLENENKCVKSNRIKTKDVNTKNKEKYRPLKCKSHVTNSDKKPQMEKIQPIVINKNIQLRKNQSNNIVEGKKVDTKSLLNSKINQSKKKQKPVVSMKIAAGTDTIDLMGKNKSPKKRKVNGTIVNKHQNTICNIKVKDFDFDDADELILNAKKKKLNEIYKQEDKEVELFPQENLYRKYLKKQKIKQMMVKNDVNRNSIKVHGNELRNRMMERLKGKFLKSVSNKSEEHNLPVCSRVHVSRFSLASHII